MSKTVAELIYDLAKRTGVPDEHEAMKPLLGISAVIPDDVVAKLSELMTPQEAKNSLIIKNHFIAGFGDGIVSAVMRQAEERGVNLAELEEEFKNEKSSGKKVQKLVQKIIESEETKGKANKDKEPEVIAKANQLIKESNEKYLKLQEEMQSKLTEKDQSLAEYKRNNELTKLLSQQLAQTPWSDQIPEPIRETVFNEMLKKEMEKLGAIMPLEGDKLVLKQSADPALIFHYQNKEFTPADLVHKVMADNKLIAVAQKATEPKQMTGFRSQATTTVAANGAQHKAPSAFSAALNQSMADQEAQQ